MPHLSECTELASRDWHFLSFEAATIRELGKRLGFSSESVGGARKGHDGFVREINKGRTIGM